MKTPLRLPLFTSLLFIFLSGTSLALPSATAVAPSAGATLVPLNTTVSATFNEAMDPNLISNGAFSLSYDCGVTAVAAGAAHTLALKADGTVVSWGLNSSGQTDVPAGLSGVVAVAAGYPSLALKGDGSVVAWGTSSSVPAGLIGVVAIAAGSHMMALKGDGTVVVWGDNTYGQTSVPAGFNDVVAIAAGIQHCLALNGNGTVVAWGRNDQGQAAVPAGLTGVVAIAGGTHHSLALRGDGTVVAWGGDANGQARVPAGLNDVVAIAAGGDHSLALKRDGTAVSWGGSFSLSVPAGLTGITALSGGLYHSVALKADGTMAVWGETQYGATTVPTGKATATAAGYYHSLALKEDGTVVTWGKNAVGQTNVPVGLRRVISVAGGAAHSLALVGDGTVAAWGSNDSGQVSVPAGLAGVAAIAAGRLSSMAVKGDGTVVGWGSITVPAGLTGVVTIAAGGIHYLALKGDGTVVAWGSDFHGSTIMPAGLSDVVAVAAGAFHSLALKRNGTVVAWGDNHDGQSRVPSGLTGVVAIAAAMYYSMALKDDGTVVGWGNRYPVPPAGLTGVVGIAAGSEHCLALMQDGRVVAWGNSAYVAPATTDSTNLCSVPGAISYDPTTKTATFAPSSPLPYSARINASFSQWLRGASGGQLTADVRWQFQSVLDGTPPVTAAAPGGASYAVPQKVMLTCNDGTESGCAATFYCQGSGCNPRTLYMDGVRLSASTDLRYYSLDRAGNAEATRTASYQFPPDTAITSAPDPLTTVQDATFTLVGNGTGSFQCRLDGGSYAPCSSPSTHLAVADGLHTFHARFVDATGNMDTTPALYSWTVDSTAPALTVSAPSNGSTIQTAHLTVNGTVSDLSGVRSVTVNGTAVTVDTSGSFSHTVLLSRGVSTTIAVAATDNAGNSSSDTRTITFRDTLPPSCNFQGPFDGDDLLVGANGNVSISGSSSDGHDGSGVKSVQVTDERNQPVGITMSGLGDWGGTWTSYLAPGIHTLTCTATDVAGNVGPASKITVRVINPSVGIESVRGPRCGIIKIPIRLDNKSTLQVGSATFTTTFFKYVQNPYPTNTYAAMDLGFTPRQIIAGPAALAAEKDVQGTISEGYHPCAPTFPGTPALCDYLVDWDIDTRVAGLNQNVIAGGDIGYLLATATKVGEVKQGYPRGATTSTTGAILPTGVFGQSIYSVRTGDLNNSGVVDIGELQTVINQHLTVAAVSPMADVNDDGVVSVAEVQLAINENLGYCASSSYSPPLPINNAVELSLGTAAGSAGSDITLPLTLTNRSGLEAVAVAMTIAFDPAKFEVVAVSRGAAAVASSKSVNYEVPTPGTIKLVIAGVNHNAIDNGVVATLVLRIKAGVAAGIHQISNQPAVTDSIGQLLRVAGANAMVSIGSTPLAAMSTPRGRAFNGHPVDVVLSANRNAVIYYTSNGTTPTTSSSVYNKPISITGSSTLKFMAVDDLGNVSPVTTEVFVIDVAYPVVSAGGNLTRVGLFTLAGSASDASAMSYLWTKLSGPGSVSFGNPRALSTAVSASLSGTYKLRLTATDAAGNSAYSDMTLAWRNPTLFVLFAGTGGGSVSSLTAAAPFACTGLSCNRSYGTGTALILRAVPDSASLFSGWSGGCSGINDCSLTIDNDITVTANFGLAPLVMIGTTPYLAFDVAYAVANNGAVIRMKDGVHSGTVTANRPIAVTLQGGYNGNYTAVSADTTVMGPLVIRSGTVRTKRIKVK